jgi:FixJ family two-component response regulator
MEPILFDRSSVFVVDDDPSMLRSIARLLRQFGYESLLFPSAEAFANHKDFTNAACVVLDVNLGDASGIELRDRLRSDGHSVPVIYMTGNDTPDIRNAALRSGCIAYLTKPFSAESLIAPIKQVST